MTQHQISHQGVRLPPCPPPCHRQPKHFEDRRGMRSGGGHFFECSACDRRTTRQTTAEAVLQEWCRLVGATPKGAQADLLSNPRLRAVR